MKLAVGINQYPPDSPTHYPLVEPDPISDNLVQDLYLSFNDPYNEFEFPFRIRALAGFGTASPQTGDFNPEETWDISIVDKNGRIVFDSTQPTGWNPWKGLDFTPENTREHSEIITADNSLRSVTWTIGPHACRIIVSEAVAADVPAIFYPDVEMDPRTLNRLAARVSRIILNGQHLDGNIRFESGNNLRLTVEEVDTGDGERNVTQISFRALPGDGDGRMDGCDETVESIRTINQVSPDASGNISIDVEGCYRLQRPGEITTFDPREFSLGGDEFEADLEAQITVTDINRVPGYNAEAAKVLEIKKSAMQIYGDCEPCCSCNDYANTYKGLRQVYESLQAPAVQAKAARVLLQDSVARWEAQRRCREEEPLRLLLHNGFSCRFNVGAVFFNFTDCCLSPVQLRLTIQLFGTNTSAAEVVRPISAYTFRAGADTNHVEEHASFSGSSPVFDMHYDNIDGKSGARFRGLFLTEGCETGWRIRATLTAHTQNHQVDGPGSALCHPDISAEVPTAVSDLWIDNPPLYPTRAILTEDIILTKDNGYC